MSQLNPSPWTNDVKKRPSTMNGKMPSPESEIKSVEESIQENQQTSQRVSALLNKLTADNDGDKLSNFEPISRPQITVSRDSPPVEVPDSVRSRFSANDINLANLSNYQQTYASPRLFPGRNSTTTAVGDDKLMEKINYMIHLLEEQQTEKTANVTEEFILYILLGVFVIFTVDSFTRVGKYVR